MMAEALARLVAIAPLQNYRYVGMGSEFFNDFSLLHQYLGINSMISIERDAHRMSRCVFNKPYKCIEVKEGTSSEVLPQLTWNERNIVWLDYTGRLKLSELSDIQYLVSQVVSGSVLIWSFNAEPWDEFESEDELNVSQSELPQHRLKMLKNDVGAIRVPSELRGSALAKWGLGKEYHRIIVEEIDRTLADRNDSSDTADQLVFRQCFYFFYRDGARMMTVGGVLVNPSDNERFGPSPFAELSFIRPGGSDAFEIDPPLLTSREVRHLNRLMPHRIDAKNDPDWLTPHELTNFISVYRYYPLFAESEL